MTATTLHPLELALAAFAELRTPARITAALRAGGSAALEEVFKHLRHEQLFDVQRKAIDMSEAGIDVVMFGDDNFPASLVFGPRPAAPILFFKGNKELLYSEGVGMCGSRNVSAQGLAAASKSGETVSAKGLTVVSGYAKGVDTATHLAALRTGGSTVIVLAEGFDHFRVKRDFAKDFDADRTLIVSQFAPTQTWQAHAAMARNAIIYGLSKALLVIEAGERGGTLAAGQGALGIGRPVLVVDFGDQTPEGNRILLDEGAIPVRTTNSLSDTLDELPGLQVDPEPPALF